MDNSMFTMYDQKIIECRQHLLEFGRMLEQICDDFDLSTRDKEKLRATREKVLGSYYDLLEI